MNNTTTLNTIRNFPLLSPQEFSNEIHCFAEEFLDKRSVPFTFLSTEDDDAGIFDKLECLNFWAFASFTTEEKETYEEESLEMPMDGHEEEENDEEALPPRESSPQRISFEFSIVHSPVSLLPQLLYRPSSSPPAPIPSSARVTLAFPSALTSSVEHPVTGKTEGWRFVHGCEGQTAMTAMKSVLEEGAAGYLEIWMGVVGVGWAVAGRDSGQAP
ncbi:hypothetical protein BJ508DRAFT_360757 [Ascobolus immersus RN42]|uniref:Uncharacterized protein n=1 Tax=Ascobolus immersus RN42 TaxID=1160509 RepID=A0A3N4IAF0_ASCIM|nr:hypothetical protein BJ508DRAFT_360757 [Ascobolus immersus RN42]